ncbi:hypothetical protein E2C01_065394 [Portunus trituberculatus]|uniref:Uncharacterized protein n=1 Tax=Portunus trituberculatus TaxID=210409 RepID=A0A5B7HN94_PORTR|nr:hypothetical protein [Portunus trituberculatus]
MPHVYLYIYVNDYCRPKCVSLETCYVSSVTRLNLELYRLFSKATEMIHRFRTMTRFHIHSSDYLMILYSSRNSCQGLN